MELLHYESRLQITAIKRFKNQVNWLLVVSALIDQLENFCVEVNLKRMLAATTVKEIVSDFNTKENTTSRMSKNLC